MSVIKRYRKREPIEVEAARVTIENVTQVAEWCNGRLVNSSNLHEGEMVLGQPVGIKLVTKNRLQVALLGDYIYKDHEDFFHVSHLSDFNFEYEPIQDQENKV